VGAAQSDGECRSGNVSWGAGVIAFIGAILVMTIVHEFGHYITAKKFGMKVEEYFIGFGPRLLSVRRGDTEFGLKPILVGAYVKIAGMNPYQTVSAQEFPRTFGAKPSWQRAIVLAGGSATHPILAVVLLWAVLALVGIPLSTTTISAVSPTVAIDETREVPAPAKEAGLRKGDELIAINNKPVKTWAEFQKVIQSSGGETVELEVLRDGRRLTLSVTPQEVAREFNNKIERFGMIGVEPVTVNERSSPIPALGQALKQTGLFIAGSVITIPLIFSPNGIGRVFAALRGDGERGTDDPVGLVGAGRLAGQTASGGGPAELVHLLAFMIVIIGVLNLLPLPPLDGGHLLILAIEKVRGKKVDMRRIVPIGVAVLGFFLILFTALLYLDIVRPVVNPFQ
jgi:membrane-associated protease RseP (regulator of RpoE activity)